MKDLAETVGNRIGRSESGRPFFIFFNRPFARAAVYSAQKISLKAQPRRFVACGIPI